MTTWSDTLAKEAAYSTVTVVNTRAQREHSPKSMIRQVGGTSCRRICIKQVNRANEEKVMPMPSAMAFNTRASAFAAIDSGGGDDKRWYIWMRPTRCRMEPLCPGRNVDSERQRHIFSAILSTSDWIAIKSLCHYQWLRAVARRAFPTNWKNTDDLTAKPSKSQIVHGIDWICALETMLAF